MSKTDKAEPAEFNHALVYRSGTNSWKVVTGLLDADHAAHVARELKVSEKALRKGYAGAPDNVFAGDIAAAEIVDIADIVDDVDAHRNDVLRQREQRRQADEEQRRQLAAARAAEAREKRRQELIQEARRKAELEQIRAWEEEADRMLAAEEKDPQG